MSETDIQARARRKLAAMHDELGACLDEECAACANMRSVMTLIRDLLAAVERQQWQPIETLPALNYGDTPVEVLLYGPSLGVRQGRGGNYPDGYRHADLPNVNGNIVDEVSHWRPLPEPPR